MKQTAWHSLCILVISSLRMLSINAAINRNDVTTALWHVTALPLKERIDNVLCHEHAAAFVSNSVHSNPSQCRKEQSTRSVTISNLRGGSAYIPSGWHPMGYKITTTGESFLALGDSLTCDVGRFLASLKSSRKTKYTLKAAWLEIVRHAKTAQAMRIYRTMDDLIAFCLKTGMID